MSSIHINACKTMVSQLRVSDDPQEFTIAKPKLSTARSRSQSYPLENSDGSDFDYTGEASDPTGVSILTPEPAQEELSSDEPFTNTLNEQSGTASNVTTPSANTSPNTSSSSTTTTSFAPHAHSITTQSTSKKASSTTMTKSWSMLEMHEMQIIHHLQDDMENMLSPVREEVHPNAMNDLRYHDDDDHDDDGNEGYFMTDQVVQRNEVDDEGDDYLFYDDEDEEGEDHHHHHHAEQQSQIKSEEVNIPEDLDRLSAIDEEEEEEEEKTIRKLTKRNVFRRLGMKRTVSLANFRLLGGKDMDSSSSREFAHDDLDSSSHRRKVSLGFRLDGDEDEDGNDDSLVDAKTQDLDLDVTVRRVNKSIIEGDGPYSHSSKRTNDAPDEDIFEDNNKSEGSGRREGIQSISPHSIMYHPDNVTSQQKKEAPLTLSAKDSLLLGPPRLLPPVNPAPRRRSSSSYSDSNSSVVFQHNGAKKPPKSILRKSSIGSLTEACSLTTNEDETSSNEETNSNKKQNMKRTTSFSTLEIREYNVTIGDNPGGSHGPPISLDWDYCPDRTINMCIEKYERIRPPRRKKNEFYMNGSIRMWTLMKEQGYSLREIRDAAKAAEQIRKKRERSLSKNPIHKLGYKVGKIFGR